MELFRESYKKSPEGEGIKIIGVLSSPRVYKISTQEEKNILESSDIMSSLYEVGNKGKISNSQVLLLAALWGAKKEGAEVRIVYPGDLTPKFDGAVLSTPVYFGDRSSTLQDFIHRIPLERTAVGVVSSGAKRNGGQETTNAFTLFDCSMKGALVTGNGPPTAQYGGTGWAGNKTAIINDDFGIKTSYGTGRQVVRLVKTILTEEEEVKPNILIITDGYESLSGFTNSKVKTLNLNNLYIKECKGCPICPNGDVNKNYTCMIHDDMEKVQQEVSWADCIILLISKNTGDIQRFMERTRFIRRNHFELSEKVFSAVSSISDVKLMKSMCHMLRHNMFGLPMYNKGKWENYVATIEKYTKKSKIFREKNRHYYKYTPVGYEDAKIADKAYKD